MEKDTKGAGESKCPFSGGKIKQSAGNGPGNRDWWPNQLKLNILRQHAAQSNPMDTEFNYAEAFKSLDLSLVKKDIFRLKTTTKSHWPDHFI